MKIRYVVLLVATVIGLLLGSGLPAIAQTGREPTGFKNVQLWVYPEYDDPRLLVMLQGQITGPDAPLKVRFLVPTAAEMYSAGSIDAQGNYSGGPPDRQPSQVAGWDEISYELKTNIFRVEYYDPVIATQSDKKFAYDFRWLYPISDLRVIIQQPLKSANFTVSPQGTASTEQGYNVLVYQYRDLDQNAPLHFDIAYTRSDSRPSTNVGTAAAPDTALVVTTLITVGVLLGVGVVWAIRSRHKAKPRKSAARAAAAAKGGQTKRFCTQCGRPMDGEARFCPNCGNRLRNR